MFSMFEAPGPRAWVGSRDSQNPWQRLTLALTIFLYGIVLALNSNGEFPQSLFHGGLFPYLIDKPVGEDGFYMLSVAWRIAHGDGITVNFSEPVTGIQPLATFLYAALAWIVKSFGGDKLHYVRAVIVFGTACMIALCYLIARIAFLFCRAGSEIDARAASDFAFLIALTSFFIFRLATYGLETGIYLILVACCVVVSLDFLRTRQRNVFSRQNLLFGALVGMTGLARVDFGVAFFVFALAALIKFRKTKREIASVGVIALVIVAPWLAYVWAVSGTPVPSSGPAQSQLITLSTLFPRMVGMANALFQILVPTLFTGGRWDIGGLSAVVALLLGIMSLKQRITINPILFVWVLAFGVLVLIYTLFFWAGHFYSRYVSPMLVLTIPIVSYVCSGSVFFRKICAQLPLLIRPVLTIVFLGIFFFFAAISLHTGRLGNTHALTAGYVAEYYGTAFKVGAFQSGVVGFVNDNVINLDGKLNHEILPYVKLGNIDGYLARHPEIEVIVDWPEYIQKFISNKSLIADWRECEEAIPMEFSVCYRRAKSGHDASW